LFHRLLLPILGEQRKEELSLAIHLDAAMQMEEDNEEEED